MNRWRRLGAVGAGAAALAALAAGPFDGVDPGPAGAATFAKSSAAAATAVAPGFQYFWAIHGPNGADAGNDMERDEVGNIFLAGSHGGLDPDRDGSLDLTADKADILFMKLSPREPGGQPHIDWMRSVSASGFEFSSAVAPDRAGGMYGIGRFGMSVSFDRGPTLPTRGMNDSYIVRYGPDGDVLWARVFGGPGQDALNGVASDVDGNVYVVGWGEGRFALDEETEFPGGDGPNGAIVSFDPDGRVRWAHAVAAPNRILWSVEASADELLVSGELEGSADLDGDGRVDVTATSERDGFMARLDTDGVVQAAWSIPAIGRAAALPDGDVLVLSAFGGQIEDRYGPADFDGDGTPELVPESDETRVWIARFGSDGSRRWVRAYNLTTPADIKTDGERIILPGGYSGILDLDEDGEFERVDHRSEDESFNTEMAILVIDAETGVPELAWTAPGPGKDQANSVVIGPGERTVYVTGFLQLTADFTGDGEHGEGWASCGSLGDLFFAAYELPPRLRLFDQ